MKGIEKCWRAAGCTAGFLIMGFWGTTSFALEWQPEFQGLNEEEQEIFEGPWRMGSEYPSDILTYTKPFYWEYDWLIHPYALDVAFGSTSAVHFMVDNRLKIHKDLIDRLLEVRVNHFKEQNMERDSVHTYFELAAWPVSFLGLSLYGEPSLYKREDDLGAALLIRPTERHEIRVFNTWVDVTRQKRSDRMDKYVDPSFPSSRGIVGRLWSRPTSDKVTGDYFEYAFRHETPTRWDFPEQEYEYRYWKLFGSLMAAKETFENVWLHARVQADRKFESRSKTAATSGEPDFAMTTGRLFLIGEVFSPFFGPWKSWELLGGVEYAERYWDATNGKATYRDLMPHLWIRFPTFGQGATEDRLGLGYEFTWHREFLVGALHIPRESSDGRVEHRLNLSYHFNFKNKASLVLIATADLDQFGTRYTWEGGAGQFKLYF